MGSNLSRVSARRYIAFGDLCGLTLLALVLNFIHLGTKSVWLDESTSLGYAHLNLTALGPVLRRYDPNMGLYYVLLNLWEKIFGESEFAARSLSAISGALCVPALYLLGARLYGRAVGLTAGLLLACNTFLVEYAQTVRSYALLALLVTLSSYFLVMELEEPSKRNRISYVLTSTMAVYAHYFAGYVLLVHFGTVLALRRRSALNREWLGVGAAIVLLCAPEALFAYRAGTGAISWISRLSLKEVEKVFVNFAGGSPLLLLALLAGGLYASAMAVWERRYWPNLFVAAWLVVPVVLTLIVSLVRPMFLPRYLIIIVPALILFGASALAKVTRPVWIGLLVAPLLWLSGTHLLDLYSRKQFEDWRDATQYVLAAAHPGDGIAFFPKYAKGPFEYYQRRDRSTWPMNIEALPRFQGQRTWLVIRKSDAAGRPAQISQLESSLAVTNRLADRHEFDGVAVELYQPIEKR